MLQQNNFAVSLPLAKANGNILNKTPPHFAVSFS